MERTDVEFATETSHTAEAEIERGEKVMNESPYGKFKDAKSLLKAYESLESEFTRRSQRLKAIEGEFLQRSQKEKTVANSEGKANGEMDFYGRYPNSSPFAEEIESEVAKNSLAKEEAYIKILERNLSEMENNLKEKDGDNASFGKDFSQIVIKEYLKKIMKEKPKTSKINGVFISVPPFKPTTVAEASAMAKNYIKRKGV